MILSNASPLIYLSKINKIHILKSLFNYIIIPKAVYEEVIAKGRAEKFLDVLKKERAINDSCIKVKDTKINREIQQFSSEIDEGEIALISLANELKPNLIIIDDASARTIAESLGFNVKGTLFVLLKACKKGLIKKEETKKLVNKLVFSGFRISQEIYIQFLEELEKS